MASTEKKLLLKLPERLPLGIKNYKLVKSKTLPLDYAGAHGLLDSTTETITIASGLSDAQCMVTLLHEVVHHGNYCMSIGLNEDQIDQVANVFAEFLVRCLGIRFDWGNIHED